MRQLRPLDPVGEGEAEPRMEKTGFFAIMAALPAGVAIVTTLDVDGVPRGLTTSAICSVSAEPPLLLVCVDKRSNTLPALLHAKKWVVNFLSGNRGDLGNLFASKEADKFGAVVWRPASNGMPLLYADSFAHAVCTTEQTVNAGDHVILVGQVEDGEAPHPSALPLMYFRRTYRTWPTEWTQSGSET